MPTMSQAFACCAGCSNSQAFPPYAPVSALAIAALLSNAGEPPKLSKSSCCSR